MNSEKIKKIVLAAMFAALTCVATMIIQIPSPMNGYINMGDCIILLSAWLLGPAYSMAAAGIGSALADILTGYVHYAPGTLVIKALVAFTACMVVKMLDSHIKTKFFARTVAGIFAEAVMVIGYFGYASLLLGKGLAAASSIPGNIIQGAAGVAASVLIYEALAKAVNIKKIAK